MIERQIPIDLHWFNYARGMRVERLDVLIYFCYDVRVYNLILL